MTTEPPALGTAARMLDALAIRVPRERHESAVRFEYVRKLLHIALTAFGCLALHAYATINTKWMLWALPASAAIAAPILERVVFICNDLRLTRIPIRSRERSSVGSTTWAVWGTLLALAISGPTGAFRGLIVVATADAAASLVGVTVGRRPLVYNRTKSVEGLAGGYIASTTAALVLYGPTQRAIILGLVCAIAESACREPVDDNFVCQVAVALASTLFL